MIKKCKIKFNKAKIKKTSHSALELVYNIYY